MKIFIIDASVVLASLLGENKKTADDFKKLLRLAQKKKIELFSPTLILLEVANGLRLTVKDQKLAQKTYEKLTALPIKLFELKKEQGKEALRLAYELQATVYDCSYHILAKLLGGVFLTCDKNYYKKAKRIGNIKIFSS